MIAEVHQNTFQISRQEEIKPPVNLSLVISQGSLSFCLFTAGYARPLEMAVLNYPSSAANLAENIDFFLTNYQLLRYTYESINISVLNPDFTILPAAFRSANAHQLLEFTTGKQSTRHLTQHLKEIDLIAGFDEEVLSMLEKSFPGAHIRHGAAVSLGLFASQKSLSSTDLFLQINGQHLELMARKEGKLLFYNLFSQHSDEDVLYYLLFVMEQFSLDPAQVQLSVAGDRPQADPLIQMLANYVKHINYCAHDNSIELKGEFLKLPSHLYFNLINQHLCE